MQRLLSLATLAVLGGLAWLFLREGGIDSASLSPNGGRPSGESLVAGADLNELFGKSDVGSSDAQLTSTQGTPAAGLPTRQDGKTIRIASFNIQAFGDQKADNAAVMQTLAEIVRRFHIVAIQEIRTQDDYFIPNFVRLVNQQGRQFDALVGPRIGNSTATEQYAYLFDDARVECDFNTSYTIRDPENLLHREPLVASFRTRGVPADRAFTFTLVNVHVDPNYVAEELDVLAEVYRVVRLAGRNEDDVVMLGDFNADQEHLGRLGKIPGVKALIRDAKTNTRRTAQYDNLIIHQPSTTEFVGTSGVFDFMHVFNLSQENALSVSDHLPVYAEFSAYELDYAGRIASRIVPTRR